MGGTDMRYPQIGEVAIRDSFWSGYLDNIRSKTLPHTFQKMEEDGYLQNFLSVIANEGKKHMGPPFSDGLFLESLRGACDFLAAGRDAVLEAYIDKVSDIIIHAAEAGEGFLCTHTTQNCPDKKWGDNGGDIVVQHDLYDHGTLIEAAISHYNATGNTKLLRAAVRAANLICDTMGEKPKKNIVPGHSLPEEAMVKLYRLFRDDKSLSTFAKENDVQPQRYLDMAEFWYDARGDHEGRFMAKGFRPEYNQDHITFAKQTEAVGHSVRAMLCYLGAAAVAREKDRADFGPVLRRLWENVVYKKLHISGGIGARHDIEGFDVDYHLPNKAYLETCAAIGLAFWNAEMHLISPDSRYFDCLERSLYNNILAAVGADFRTFFYQNPLESDGNLHRWTWHVCPCCPPMLLKIFSALNSFIYAFDGSNVYVNLFIGSRYETGDFSIEQGHKKLCVDSKGKRLTVKVRIPEYVSEMEFRMDEKIVAYETENGYAVFTGVWEKDIPLVMEYKLPVRRIYADSRVKEDAGKVAVMRGPFVMCAEGIDNGGNVDITIAENPCFEIKNENVYGKTAQGGEFCLIPYYRWCNRGDGENDAKMVVWLPQENMIPAGELDARLDGRLYGTYES